MMVDITDIPDVKLEDTVTLIGKDGDNYISVEDMANLAGSFNYEFVCDVGKRVPRVYKRQIMDIHTGYDRQQDIYAVCGFCDVSD